MCLCRVHMVLTLHAYVHDGIYSSGKFLQSHSTIHAGIITENMWSKYQWVICRSTESAVLMCVYVCDREHGVFCFHTLCQWVLDTHVFVCARISGWYGWERAIVCGDDDDKHNQHDNTVYHTFANRKQIADSPQLRTYLIITVAQVLESFANKL